MSARLPGGSLGTGFVALAKAAPRARLAGLHKYLQGLLRWQRDLSRWPTLPSSVKVPDATPFVSLYARGKVRGCFGVQEGAPRERIARAFLRSMYDARFPEMRAEERGELTAEIAYAHAPTRIRRAELPLLFEAGTHGLSAAYASGARAVLFPDVAYDGIRNAAEMLSALERKGGQALLPDTNLVLFGASRVTVRGYDADFEDDEHADMAAAWLAGLLGPDGDMVFAIDGRTSVATLTGPAHHARAAVVIKALLTHGAFKSEALRARERLVRDLRAGLGGAPIPAFPKGHAEVCGTLALATLAGAPLHAELLQAASGPALLSAPWYAAQVVCALGERTPRAVFQVCVSDLRKTPWAPWTAMAAHVLGEDAIYNQCAGALASSIRSEAPYMGAVSLDEGAVPEIALTAAAVEALALRPSSATRGAITRARAFLRRAQLTRDRTPACVDPRTARGAFPASPSNMLLRADVTAHALLALLR